MVLPVLTPAASCNINSYMKQDSKLSSVLHVLLHMAHQGRPLTSEELSKYLGTNPVVVRRTLAGLREAGLVTSARGAGGGWALARGAGAITLRDVHAALGERLLQGIDVAGPAPPAGGCRIQRAVAGTLDEFLDDAEALLAARLGRITLAELAARVRGAGAARHAPPDAPPDAPPARSTDVA